jgi:hypothetical protein
VAGIDDQFVRLLDQPAQEVSVGFSGNGFAKTREDALDGRLRGDFTKIVATHAICKNEKPAVRSHSFRGFRCRVPYIVFIALAHAPKVREFREFDIHRKLWRRQRARRSGGCTDIRHCTASVH